MLIRLLPLLALAWIAAPPAQAGTYDVYWCKAPGGRYVPDEAVFQWNVEYIAAGSSCGAPGGRLTISMMTGRRRGGDYARAEINAPWATRIVRADIERVTVNTTGVDDDLAASPSFDVAANVASFAQPPNWQVLHRCAYFTGCFLEGANEPAIGWSLGGASSLRFEVNCGGQPEGTCYEGAAPRVETNISAIHLVLQEDSIPAGKVVSGSMSSDGPKSGTESVLVDTADLGSGVFRVAATLDGVPVGEAGPGGNCVSGAAPGSADFDRMIPCPPEANGLRVPIDTTRVGDGSRKLRVTVFDAAGNSRLFDERNVVIDNVPPPAASTPPVVSGTTFPNALRPGDKLTAKNGTWTGTGLSFSYRWQRYDVADQWSDIGGAAGDSYVVAKADVDRKLRVVVTAKNSEGSAEAASGASGVVQSGATVSVASLAPGSAPQSEPSSPQLVLDREQRSVQVRYGAKIVVTGRLVDADTASIADADVDVFEQLSVVGSPWRKVATIKTDSQGGYVYRPATTGGRVLRFAYAAKRDGGDYRATREVVIAVTAGMDIKAVRRSIPAQGVIRLRGRVLAEPLPAAGTWVEIQVLDAGVWRTVGTRRTSPTGQWTYKHRVRRTSNATFAFRARLRQMSDVPAIESKSTPVKVHVR